MSDGTRSVVFVTQWFTPEPSVQPLRIAKELKHSGHDVSVLTGFPNYPTGQVQPGYRASRPGQDEIEGLSVFRAPLYPSHDRSAIKRFLNYGSWALSATLFWSRLFKGKDVSLVYSSPATAAFPAMVAKRMFKVPYVLLIQDVWPDSIFASGFLKGRVAGITERVLTWFVGLTYRGASRIAVTSPGMHGLLVARGVPAEKLALIYNAVEDDGTRPKVEPVGREELGLGQDEMVFMYAGNHGAAQSLNTLIDAVGRLPETSGVRLVMIGAGTERDALRDLAASLPGGHRILFLDAVPREQVHAYTEMADVQIVSLADRPLFAVTMPSKVQSILSAGQPMLAIAAGDVASIVTESGCGLAADPGDRGAVTEALNVLAMTGKDALADMGASGRRYYEEQMSPTVNAQRLSDLVDEAAGP